MIVILIYLILAAASVFAFCVGKKAVVEMETFNEDTFFLAPMIFGFLWPAGWTIYAPYLYALYVIQRYKEDSK